jgi:hypothetical protein
VTTDKYCYDSFENVEITVEGNFTVAYIAILSLVGPIIFNESGDVVVEPVRFNGYVLTVIGRFEGTRSYTWNRTYEIFNKTSSAVFPPLIPPSGQQVPEGKYTIYFGWWTESMNARKNYLMNITTPAEIIIGDCPSGPTADAGPDQTVNEGDAVLLDGSGSSGSVGEEYWDELPFGADAWIANAPAETIIATFDYGGTEYIAFAATDYGSGKATFAVGTIYAGLFNIEYPGNVRHQVFINSVKWATGDMDPSSCNVLVVWGHREILTYWTGVPGEQSSNVILALEDVGYNVVTSHDIPASLAGYDAVIIPGIGWTWGGWVDPSLWSGPGGTNTAHKPTADEVASVLNFVQNGGGLVASAEWEFGAAWLNDISDPMGIHFEAVAWDTPMTAYRVIDHPTFLKWESGASEIVSYEWDFTSDGIYDYVETAGSAPDGDSDGKTTHIFGDNGVYQVTLKITDENGTTDMDTANITVNNVAPTITGISAFTRANVTLRLAGEKWHDASIRLFEDGSEIWMASVVRYPGSPDDQSVTVEDVYLDLTKEYSAKVVYTPDDDPVNGQPNGANPAWIILTFEDGTEERIHHTFNVKHPETWEWNVILNPHLAGHEVTIESSAEDPGSDDLIFDWGFGVPTVHFNDGLNPDPYPSPDGVFPFEAEDVFKCDYPGSGILTLKVTDDDGGLATATIILA